MFKVPKIEKQYLILALVYFTGIAAPINQFKVPPMLSQLMLELNISLSVSGWLMSSFALAGFIFTLPSGFLLRKVGVKNMSIMALLLMLLGSLLGGTASHANILLFSRVLEGAGMALISITAPAAISAWFPLGRRGISIGIWATWVPAGNIAVFIAAPHLGLIHWHNAWLFCSIYTAIMLLLFFLFFSMPQNYHNKSTQEPKHIEPFKFTNILPLAVIFMLFNIITISIKSYLPVFLENFYGFSQVKASGIIIIMMVCSVISAPFAGIISDKIKSRKKLIIFSCIGGCITALTVFTTGDKTVVYALICIGIAGGAMPAGIFTAATEFSNDASNSGRYMSVIVFGQYMGMFGGPIIFSTVADIYGWNIAAYTIGMLGFLALITALKLKLK